LPVLAFILASLVYLNQYVEIVSSADFNYNYIPTRYVKNCIDGSDVNPYNHWTEIEAWVGGTNVALNKSVSINGGGYFFGSVATDGAKDANHQDAGTDYYSCITVDLGATYQVDTVKVWHFFYDGRSYYNNGTSVGTIDTGGTNMLSSLLYLSSISGIFAETSSGQTLNLRSAGNSLSESFSVGVGSGTWSTGIVLDWLRVELVGGSGGGGGGAGIIMGGWCPNYTDTRNYNGLGGSGGGGGAGGYVSKVWSNPNANSVLTYNVGAGGAGGAGAFFYSPSPRSNNARHCYEAIGGNGGDGGISRVNFLGADLTAGSGGGGSGGYGANLSTMIAGNAGVGGYAGGATGGDTLIDGNRGNNGAHFGLLRSEYNNSFGTGGVGGGAGGSGIAVSGGNGGRVWYYGAGNTDYGADNGTAGASGWLSIGYSYTVALNNVFPTSGLVSGGTVITLYGNNVHNNLVVTVGGQGCQELTIYSASIAICKVPPGTAGAKDVSLSSFGVTVTLPNAFTYLPPAPTVSGVSPSAGSVAGGNSVVVSGTSFRNGDTTIRFDGTVASCTYNSETQMTCSAPAHAAGTVSVSATTAGGTGSLGNAYTYMNVPTITAVSPSSGSVVGGDSVVLSGANFVNGGTTIRFGTAVASCSFVSTTQMNCTVPAGSAGGATAVSVTTAGGTTSLSGGYTYIVSLSLALNKSELEMSGVPGDLIADYLIANVKTDNPKGYNLSIESTRSDLICTGDSSSYKITALPSTAGAMQDNKWGYSVSAGASPPSSWAGVTTTTATIDSSTSPTDLTMGRDTKVWFGLRVDFSLPVCSYDGEVTFTAVGI
jgi:hypothetical protein